MSKEHKQRVITALVAVPLLLAIYFFLGHTGLVLLTIAISVASFAEFLAFTETSKIHLNFSLLLAFILSVWLSLNLPGNIICLYLVILAFVLHGLWRVHSTKGENLLQEFLATQTRVFALVYLVVFLSFVPQIHAMPHGPSLFLFLLGVIWVGDISAYYGGKSFGKNKLSPSISPGKTLEGSLTALVFCALWGIGLKFYALQHMSLWKAALLAVSTSVIAQSGDLVESMIKRAYQKKDSGTLIPGHGGVFDRFDSLILAAPFFYFLLCLIS